MLEKSKLIAELRLACELPHVRQSFRIREVSLSGCDLLITSPCVGVFFAVDVGENSIVDLWHAAEREITELKESSTTSLPRDLALAIVVPEFACSRDDAQKVTADPYVSRKFVLAVNGLPLQHTLEDLPFWPTNEFGAELKQRMRGVDDLLADSGFDEGFIYDLRDSGVGVIADKLEGTFYPLKLTEHDQRGLYLEAPIEEAAHPRVIESRALALEVQDFRGIRTLDPVLNLDGDVVFFYGPNGTGKTSIIDALELATTGAVARLDQDPDSEANSDDALVNLFSEKKRAFVKMSLSKGNSITRYVDSGTGISTELNDAYAKDSQVAEIIIGGQISPDIDWQIVPDLIRHSHFLGQHSIREFISGGTRRGDPAVERFRQISKLFGREDYVRRSDKIRRLIKELQSRSFDSTEKLDSEKEKLRSLENRVKERKALIDSRQAERQSIPKLLTEARELQKQLKSIEIAVPSFPTSTKSLSEISVYLTDAETRLNSRKERLEKDLITLAELKRECAARVRRTSRLQELAEELLLGTRLIGAAEKLLEQTATTLKNAESALIDEKRAEQELQTELQQIRLLIANAPLYLAAKRRLEVESESLERLQKRLDAVRNATRLMTDETQRFEEELSKAQTELNAMERRRARIIEFGNAIDTLRLTSTEARQLAAELAALTKQIEDGRGGLDKYSAELSQVESQLASVEFELKIRDDERQRRNKLVTEISEYLDSEVCPLCGHDHTSKRQLQVNIEKQLAQIPESIVSLASNKERLLRQRTGVTTTLQRVRDEAQELAKKRELIARSLSERQTHLEEWRLLALDLRLVDAESDFESFLSEKPALVDDEYAALYEGVGQLQQRIKTRHIELDQAAKSEKEAGLEIQKSQQLLNGYSDHVNKLEAAHQHLGLSEYKEDRALKQQAILTEKLAIARKKATAASESISLAKTAHSDAERDYKFTRSSHDRSLVENNALLREEDVLKARLAAEGLTPQADESEVTARGLEVETGLASIKTAQETRTQLYETISTESLRLDLEADQDELKKQRMSLQPLEQNIKSLSSWCDDLTNTLSLIDSEQRIGIDEQIKDLEPTINKIWKRLSPHPLFDEIRLEVMKDRPQNALRILATINGRDVEVGQAPDKVPPLSFFSEAQLNVLALSIFLAISIRQVWSGFQLIAIDDPVQQMDDFNANAFFDLVRGLSQSGKQFIIATCDLHLYRMALEKFACLNTQTEKGFLAYRLTGTGKAGPELIVDTPLNQN